MASSSRLKPGEKGEIKATVETAGRTGTLVKNVRVTSNDLDRPIIDLKLYVDIMLPTTPQPAAASNTVSAVPTAAKP